MQKYIYTMLLSFFYKGSNFYQERKVLGAGIRLGALGIRDVRPVTYEKASEKEPFPFPYMLHFSRDNIFEIRLKPEYEETREKNHFDFILPYLPPDNQAFYFIVEAPQDRISMQFSKVFHSELYPANLLFVSEDEFINFVEKDMDGFDIDANKPASRDAFEYFPLPEEDSVSVPCISSRLISHI